MVSGPDELKRGALKWFALYVLLPLTIVIGVAAAIVGPGIAMGIYWRGLEPSDEDIRELFEERRASFDRIRAILRSYPGSRIHIGDGEVLLEDRHLLQLDQGWCEGGTLDPLDFSTTLTDAGISEARYNHVVRLLDTLGVMYAEMNRRSTRIQVDFFFILRDVSTI